ncbi:MAG: 30S ribosomal protein S6 [Candidatus Peribacteraceae bacterium]|nr:30S ribosomal protein S6 [Candidatus Peribacteraceae bacterium]
MTKNPANSYEVLAIFAGSLRESEFKKELEKLEAELSKAAKILNKSVWPNRQLAYKISGETTGSYFIAHFEASGDKIANLDNSLRLDPKIIRHLICRTPKNYKWSEYTEEDLEHDYGKLESAKPAAEPRYIKRKAVVEKTSKTESKIETASKPAAKKIEKKPEPKADAGELDKKLDDILADL